MIDTVLNYLFGCHHQRLTRPVTPVSKAGMPHGDTYVVCLDCGKQFAYDLKEMRIGKPIERSSDAGVLHPTEPMPRRTKVKYAFWASVPLAMLLGSFLKSRSEKKQRPKEGGSGAAG